MLPRRPCGLVLSVLLLAMSAGAQERSGPVYELTFERVIERARQQAPEILSARARIGEAQGNVKRASVWRFNPQIQVAAGPRSQGTDTTTDWSLGARQWLEIGGQTGNRIAVAQAGVAAAEARSDDTLRLLLREAALAFLQALHGKDRVDLARENRRIAEEIARVARRRYELGDTGGLQKSVASLSLARAQVAEARAAGERDRAEGRLRVILGLEESSTIRLAGDMGRLKMPVVPAARDIDTRPDLRALEAEVRRAQSEIDLGRSARIPDIRLGGGYASEEGADIVQGSLAVEIPLFDYGQGTTAVARSRRKRIEIELRARQQRAIIEIETARRTFRRLSNAARRFEAGGLPVLEASEELARKSYEAGATPLGELLAMRRELVRAKVEYAELLLEAAAARVDLIAHAGAWE